MFPLSLSLSRKRERENYCQAIRLPIVPSPVSRVQERIGTLSDFRSQPISRRAEDPVQEILHSSERSRAATGDVIVVATITVIRVRAVQRRGAKSQRAGSLRRRGSEQQKRLVELKSETVTRYPAPSSPVSFLPLPFAAHPPLFFILPRSYVRRVPVSFLPLPRCPLYDRRDSHFPLFPPSSAIPWSEAARERGREERE